jgi:hypothetical protein
VVVEVVDTVVVVPDVMTKAVVVARHMRQQTQQMLYIVLVIIPDLDSLQ